MAKHRRRKKRPDVNELAKLVVDEATGEPVTEEDEPEGSAKAKAVVKVALKAERQGLRS